MLVLPKQTKNYDPEDAADILPTNACMVKANNIKEPGGVAPTSMVLSAVRVGLQSYNGIEEELK